MVAETQDSDSSSRSTDPTDLTRKAVDALRRELTDLFDVKLDALKELMGVEFSSVDEALKAIERWRIEQKTDSAVGLAAALSAAKEAVGKTETNFNEALKGQRDTFGTAIAAQVTRYDDIDKRVTRIESIKIGGQESKAALYVGAGFVVMLILAALTVVGFVATNQP